MAAGIAHEINNPLAGVLLYGSNLLKKVPQEGPLQEGLEIIIHETVRCRTIIQDLLEFSRQREPQKNPAKINDIIEKAVNLLVNEFRLSHIEVKRHLSENIPETLLDENQMLQVFVNIMINAVEAIKERGAITIESRPDRARNRIVVEVTDTGCGLQPEQLDQIFEPFFSTKPKGTGLGLAVSFGIVQNHGGDIRVSSGLGEGTRFTIDMPVNQR
jgi:signal transduction histidine kinase